VPLQVAEDEAKHFSLLKTRLEELGSYYGAHTVHAGLWESALDTQDDLLARLAIIHLVHEARGLDVSPFLRSYRIDHDDTDPARPLRPAGQPDHDQKV
jgi:uncharacterized ferritin-like protein (DUF455 family)